MHPIWRLMLGSSTAKTALEMLKVYSCSEFQNKTLYHPPDQRCMNAISKNSQSWYHVSKIWTDSLNSHFSRQAPSFFKWVANQYDIWYLCESSTLRFCLAWKSAWKFLFMLLWFEPHTSAVLFGYHDILNLPKMSKTLIFTNFQIFEFSRQKFNFRLKYLFGAKNWIF